MPHDVAKPMAGKVHRPFPSSSGQQAFRGLADMLAVSFSEA